MSKLTPKQQKAALLLAGGEKKRVVAEKVGVTPQTISEWLKDLDFEVRINQEKQAFLERTRDRMRRLGPVAIEALKDVMMNSKTDTARLKAVDTVLHHIGYTDPQTMLWAWGIEGTDKADIMAQKEAGQKINEYVDMLDAKTKELYSNNH